MGITNAEIRFFLWDIYIYMIFFLYLIPFFVELELDGTCLHQCVDQLICGVTAILVGGSELHPINRQTNRGLSEHTLADIDCTYGCFHIVLW